ncbi:UNVERIFIED_ORG: hypothetical protein EDC92_1432 [Dietzia maris]|uniref:hypothetical protein n=1 Tax=Dietzia maris TaxID=37915 RepID=UPI001051D5AC
MANPPAVRPEVHDAIALPGLAAPTTRRDRKEIAQQSSALAVSLAETRNSTIAALSRAEGQSLVGMAGMRAQEQLGSASMQAASTLHRVGQDLVASNPHAAEFVAQRLAVAGDQLDETMRQLSREITSQTIRNIRSI